MLKLDSDVVSLEQKLWQTELYNSLQKCFLIVKMVNLLRIAKYIVSVVETIEFMHEKFLLK